MLESSFCRAASSHHTWILHRPFEMILQGCVCRLTILMLLGTASVLSVGPWRDKGKGVANGSARASRKPNESGRVAARTSYSGRPSIRLFGQTMVPGSRIQASSAASSSEPGTGRAILSIALRPEVERGVSSPLMLNALGGDTTSLNSAFFDGRSKHEITVWSEEQLSNLHERFFYHLPPPRDDSQHIYFAKPIPWEVFSQTLFPHAKLNPQTWFPVAVYRARAGQKREARNIEVAGVELVHNMHPGLAGFLHPPTADLSSVFYYAEHGRWPA